MRKRRGWNARRRIDAQPPQLPRQGPDWTLRQSLGNFPIFGHRVTSAPRSCKVGSRLEVLWTIEFGEDVEADDRDSGPNERETATKNVWWPCVVKQKTDRAHELLDDGELQDRGHCS